MSLVDRKIYIVERCILGWLKLHCWAKEHKILSCGNRRWRKWSKYKFELHIRTRIKTSYKSVILFSSAGRHFCLLVPQQKSSVILDWLLSLPKSFQDLGHVAFPSFTSTLVLTPHTSQDVLTNTWKDFEILSWAKLFKSKQSWYAAVVSLHIETVERQATERKDFFMAFSTLFF